MTGVGSVSAGGSWELLLMRASGRSGASALTGGTSSGAQATESSSGLSALQDEIKEAVTAAVSGLDKSSSAETIMKAVKGAIDSTLKANGIEPPSGTGGPRGPGGPGGPGKPGGPPPSGAGGPGGPGGPSPGASKADASSSSTETEEDPLRALIDSILAANGFNVDKIKDELEAGRASKWTQVQTETDTTTGASGAATWSAWTALLYQIQSGVGVDTAV